MNLGMPIMTSTESHWKERIKTWKCINIQTSLLKTGKCKNRWSVCREHCMAGGRKWDRVKRETCRIRRKEKQIKLLIISFVKKKKKYKFWVLTDLDFSLSLYPCILLSPKMLFRWTVGAFCTSNCNAELFMSYNVLCGFAPAICPKIENLVPDFPNFKETWA